MEKEIDWYNIKLGTKLLCVSTPDDTLTIGKVYTFKLCRPGAITGKTVICINENGYDYYPHRFEILFRPINFIGNAYGN